jgi:hypothetical protein
MIIGILMMIPYRKPQPPLDDGGEEGGDQT